MNKQPEYTKLSPASEEPACTIQTSTEQNKTDGHISKKESLTTTARPRINGFSNLNFSHEFIENLTENGWLSKTKIQEKCLPYAIQGRDLAGFAQTGTGKTGVFLLTLANHISQNPNNSGSPQITALILCPTRELAIQIEDEAKSILKPLNLSSISLYGGVNIEPQIEILKKGVQLVIATPGRFIDLYKRNEINLEQLKLFVCDEVDRVFDMGFINDVEFILEKLPPKVQRLVFSATENPKTKELAFEYLDNPEYISINIEEPTPETIDQHAIICETHNKLKILLSLLKLHSPICAIVFSNTKLTASWLHYKLKNNNLEAEMISGDLPQSKRIQLIRSIKEGKIKLLIATDVASRGLHIANVSHVYNFDIPDDSSNYVHRIGRTARAGNIGISYSLVCEDYGHNYEDIQKLLKDHAPTPVWYTEDLLQTEDIAPNPFDPSIETGSNSTVSSSSRRTSDTKYKNTSSERIRTPQRKKTNPTNSTYSSSHSSRRRSTTYSRNSQTRQTRKPTGKAPNSVGGILKRFLSLIIKKK